MIKLRKWLDHKLGVDIYELRDGRIIKERGRDPSDIVLLQDIDSWYVDYEMVFDVVTIRLSNGEEVRWLDRYDDLLGILRSQLRDKEQSPNQAPEDEARKVGGPKR